MKWSQPRVPDLKGVIDKFHLYDRVLQRNVALIQGYGTPCTYWRNMAISPIGISPNPAISTKCYCWSTPTEGGGTSGSQIGQPDRTHFLCSGTGWLDAEGKGGGYQRYGYREYIFSTPTKLTASTTDLIISGTRGSSYILSGTSLTGILTTDRITLNRFKNIDHILLNDDYDPNVARVEYSYSLDDVNWVALPVTLYTVSPIANRQATLVLPAETPYIRFRITLKKKVTTAPSPKWNALRFRYRNLLNLSEIDPRFSTITIPAFMAAREQTSTLVEGSAEHAGWTTRFPLKWKTLPDTDIENADVIKFLVGTYQGLLFETSDLIKFTYGNNTQILHRGFESSLIRDKNDILKIAAYLI